MLTNITYVIKKVNHVFVLMQIYCILTESVLAFQEYNVF